MTADLDANDLLAEHPLLQPLTQGQQAFVETIFARVTDPNNDWPVFDYVTRALRRIGYDADGELAGFPVVINSANPGFTYRHVWSEGGGRALNADSRVRLTIAGLRAEGSGGSQFAEYLVRVIGLLAELESEIVPDPDAVAEDTPDLGDVLADARGARAYAPFLSLAASILEREPPTFGMPFLFDSQPALKWKIRLNRNLSAFVGVRETDDYLRRVLTSLGAHLAPVEPPSVDRPLALVDEIGYLDAVWQARLSGRLFGAARVASCAGLALTCGSSEDFDARMNALYDVLNQIQVELEPAEETALKGKPGSLQRLRLRLQRELPSEEYTRVDTAIGLLQDAIRIRAALHSGLQGELPSRYASLGLTFPPRDYGEAWDHIRGRCASAIRAVRQTVETLPQIS